MWATMKYVSAHVDVDRHGAEHHAGEAADHEHREEAEREQHRRRKWSFPSQIVASQLKILIPVGMAMRSVVIIIGTRSHERHAAHEHVVRPDREAEDDDRHQRERHQPVAEDRLSR